MKQEKVEVTTSKGLKFEVTRDCSFFFKGEERTPREVWRKENRTKKIIKVGALFCVSEKGREFPIFAAKLMALAFIDGYDDKYPVSFKDGNIFNYSIENIYFSKSKDIASLPGECWREIPEHENYLVSNFGRVKTKELFAGNRYCPCVEVSQFERPKGKVYLSVPIDGKMYPVHRLVALSFLDNPDGLPEVNHKDENKRNNKADNLEWCSMEYNHNYGTRVYRTTYNNSLHILSTNTVTGEQRRFDSLADVHRKTGHCQTTIRNYTLNGKPFDGCIWSTYEHKIVI